MRFNFDSDDDLHSGNEFVPVTELSHDTFVENLNGWFERKDQRNSELRFDVTNPEDLYYRDIQRKAQLIVRQRHPPLSDSRMEQQVNPRPKLLVNHERQRTAKNSRIA